MVEIEESFGDINSKYDKELLPDLESIKSMVDPEDLWVKNSISEIQRVQSEYSASEDEGEYHFGAKIIKTKGNIFIQDEIMRKIVAIVCIVNPSVG